MFWIPTGIIQFLIVLVCLPATWRSMIRTAVCRWRYGTGTWPAATTSWDHCPLASRSSRNWEWMDGEIKGGMNGGRDGGTWGTAQVEEEVEEWRWPCSLLHCWRTTSVGGLGEHHYPVSLFLLPYLSTAIPPPLSLSSSVSISLYLLFFADAALSGILMRCQRLRCSGGGGEMPLKTWLSKQRTCASLCFHLHLQIQSSKAPHLLAPPAPRREIQSTTSEDSS